MADYETLNNSEIEGVIPDNTVWPDFGISLINFNEDIQTTCDSTEKLAEAVLDNYGISWVDLSNATTGGELEDLDIKRMDALTVINQSLMERGAKSTRNFIEPIVNPDGEIEFREIGTYAAEIEDVYYEVRTGSFVENPKAIMVTGKRPLPDVKDLVWKPIWGTSPVRIYTTTDMLDNCRKTDFIRYATVVFNDPQLTSAYEDGIDNLYEIGPNNPWDRIVGYVRFIDPGPLATKDTTVNYANTSEIPIQIGTELADADGPYMGNLQALPTYNQNLFHSDCWSDQGIEASVDDGVKVEIPEEFRYETIREVERDKFVRISGVYLIGLKIESLWYAPIDDPAAIQDPTTENSKLWMTINDQTITTMRLDEGRHYALAYDQEEGEIGKIPYVVFGKDVRVGDPFSYGMAQTFIFDPTCVYAKNTGLTDTNISYNGTIFPYNKYEGILVSQIWVTAELETPSITVYDPNGDDQRALNIAQNLKYYLAPIVISEPPTPIAYVGPSTGGIADLVDQRPTSDNDPTTVEDFDDREIEIYMDEMQGGGLAVNWSFLDEDGALGMADMLYSYFQSDVVETVYTCGPSCNPILGGYGDAGGIVNSIRYSYSDQGSYTVSVSEGPKIVGNLTQVDGGPTMKMMDNFSAGGKIIAVAGDNIHFKVRIDGYGERWAINMSPNILRKGDMVQVTVHNNPVEA